MNIKKIVIAGAALSTLLLMNTAHAQSGFQNTLNTALGSTFGASDCFACHVGGLSGSTATTAIARTWLAVGSNTALLASTDSDGDGFSNKQEANGITTNFNNVAVTPFTLATGGKALTNVYVTGDANATEKPITAAASGITVPVGSTILGGVAIDVYASPTTADPITLLYKAGAAALTSTVYAVDTYSIAIADPYATNTTLPLAAADWSLTPQGGVQLKQLPAGADATYDIVVVRVTPTTNLLNGGDNDSNDNDSNDDDDNTQKIACMTDVTTPLMMFGALFGLGLLMRRKS